MKDSGRVTVRVLTEADAEAFQRLRLEALEFEPQAFLSTAENERARPLDEIAARLMASPEGNFTLGAFHEGRMVGMVGFVRHTREKIRHKGLVWGMYVSRNARRRGVGRALLAALTERARGNAGLEQITLMVTTEQAAAVALYESLGFETYGLERRALKLDGRYLDEALMVLRLR